MDVCADAMMKTARLYRSGGAWVKSRVTFDIHSNLYSCHQEKYGQSCLCLNIDSSPALSVLHTALDSNVLRPGFPQNHLKHTRGARTAHPEMTQSQASVTDATYAIALL